MVSTVWNPQRGLRSYIEKREEGERGKQVKKRGNQKERDRPWQYSVPLVFSTAWNTHRDSQLSREEKGREEIEVN